MKNAPNLLIGILVLISAIFASVVFYLHASGSYYTLDHIQRVQHGYTQSQVREIMKREPQVVPASDAPQWIEEVAGQNDSGEYWYFYMGYPPRNLIIYFDESGRVVFSTWAST
ncbi:hypothetical protein N9Y42_10395 [Mariniblastus sp.]|nr:hypothetical protein [Mariniblastus sp.]